MVYNFVHFYVLALDQPVEWAELIYQRVFYDRFVKENPMRDAARQKAFYAMLKEPSNPDIYFWAPNVGNFSNRAVGGINPAYDAIREDRRNQ